MDNQNYKENLNCQQKFPIWSFQECNKTRILALYLGKLPKRKEIKRLFERSRSIRQVQSFTYNVETFVFKTQVSKVIIKNYQQFIISQMIMGNKNLIKESQTTFYSYIKCIQSLVLIIY
ncbi:unnamed protein product (macronuclear) [Paramecium tetraurelia]|uniref:Transmembrane protein n=1 Tax=Paramecium tetraurelia TaxID=5888 RepID=A0CMB9_PARTE|nr:uncharacterized protein GSPATT00008415001 [Paramecium tetraurelia]CAK71936.1 unnamed protein product [Paramecium tetraurelia]|eukprot:XP_001439333.1 hypothetical protein (macronuclear) [Paramecium tetraurelia strain d4-2]